MINTKKDKDQLLISIGQMINQYNMEESGYPRSLMDRLRPVMDDFLKVINYWCYDNFYYNGLAPLYLNICDDKDLSNALFLASVLALIQGSFEDAQKYLLGIAEELNYELPENKKVQFKMFDECDLKCHGIPFYKAIESEKQLKHGIHTFWLLLWRVCNLLVAIQEVHGAEALYGNQDSDIDYSVIVDQDIIFFFSDVVNLGTYLYESKIMEIYENILAVLIEDCWSAYRLEDHLCYLEYLHLRAEFLRNPGYSCYYSGANQVLESMLETFPSRVEFIKQKVLMLQDEMRGGIFDTELEFYCRLGLEISPDDAFLSRQLQEINDAKRVYHW